MTIMILFELRLELELELKLEFEPVLAESDDRSSHAKDCLMVAIPPNPRSALRAHQKFYYLA
jgi:hypothetical protein